MSADEINHKLRTVLQFTPEDLEANRAGRLSDTQVLEVRNKLLFRTMSFIGLSFIPLVLTVQSGRPVGYALYAILIVFIVGWSYWQWDVDVKQRRVEWAEGTLTKESYTNDQMLGRTDYTLIVGGERIDVSEREYSVFTEGEAYRVFYTPRSKQAISAEYLGQ